MLTLNRDPLTQMRQDMNRMFNAIFGDLPQTIHSRISTPPMNVWEDDRNYYIEAELPGFSMEDLNVMVLEDEVTIKGERKLAPREGVTYLRRERQAGSFSRTWTLPTAVKADEVEATLSNGVLLVTLPKIDKALPRKIEVRAITN